MAYEYDQLGNIVGEYESDEERRRRLDAEAAQQPVKQTTTYNPDGTQEVTIRGTPQALSSANPNTPTVTGPVSPDDTFRRMQQVESGNRDFNAQGQPITSPKGAMFRNQVMPATAAAPGYGIRPAQAQTPEEYNRVGQEYYQAMLKKFGGDTQKAAAAYNAGPGRVQQNMQANQGQMNVQQLPRETQGYLQKIGQAVGNMIPSAQAGTLPPAAPVAPTAMTQAAPPPPPFQGQTNEFGGMESPPAMSPYALGTQMGNQGIRIPGLTPVGQMPAPQDQTTQMITRYQEIQDNPEELMKFGYSQDPAVPSWMKDRAKTRTAELITQQREMAAQPEKIASMSESEIAQALRKKTTDGSYLKAVLFGILGMENSAQAEIAKLGIGKETMTQINGEPAMVKISSNGTPIEGYNAVTGKKLTAQELVTAVQGGGALGKGASLSADVYVDPKTGNRYRSGFDASGKTAMVNIQGGPAYRGDPKNLKIQSIDTAAQKAENAAAVKLRYAGPTSYTEAGAKAAGEFNFQNGTNIGYASQAPGAPLVDLNTGQPIQIGAGGVITTTQTGTPNVPAAAGVKTTGNQTPADIARQGKIKEAESTQFVKYASEDITPKADAGAQISRIRKEQLYGPDGILNNAELAGVLQGQGPASAEVANIFRDIITGGFKDQADLSLRVNSLGLTQPQKNVVNRQVGLMLSVNPLTLRANAGPGAVSDAEQKANREANVDFMRQPLYSGLSLLTRDQFNKDLNVARAEFKAARPDLQNTEQFNSAWSGEKAKKEKEFDQIYAERAKYIGKYNKDGKNPGAIVDAYKYYPVPVFDTQTKTWDYGTEFSKKAARPKLNEFNK